MLCVGDSDCVASLVGSQGKFLESFTIAKRAAAIFHETVFPGHPHTEQIAATVQLLELVAKMTWSALANQTNDGRTYPHDDPSGASVI